MAKHRSFLLSMILGNHNRVSSKRVLGSFVIIVMTIMVVICVFIKEDASWLSSAIDTLIITGGALLGLGIADGAFDKKQETQYGKGYNNRSNKNKTNNEEHCDDFNG